MRDRAVLSLLLLLAAALRFAGLDWGLRHVPHWDERVFVDNVWEMHAQGDLDHRYYEYPGLFSLLLYPAVGAVYRTGSPTPEAFLAARAVVAGFGVLNVALVYALGWRLGGRRLGLAAALLLAVSPVDVDTAHMVRPDVTLQTGVLLAMLSYARLGAAVGGDVRAGLATGAAVAVKFTGAFLAPAYLVARWLAPGPRLSRVAFAGMLGVLVLVGTTPYALINRSAYLESLGVQVGAHYTPGSFAPELLNHLGYYLSKIVFLLGPVGAALAVLGLVVVGRGRLPRWLPLVVHVLVTVVVMSTAELRFQRHLVPTSGLLCLLAALPLAHLSQARPRLALGAAVLAAAWPFAASFHLVRGFVRPGTADRALDWIESRAAPDAVILDGSVGFQELGLDHRRYDVLKSSGAPERDRRLAREADFVISVPPSAMPVAGWIPTLVEPESELSGPAIGVFQVPEPERFRYAAVRLDPRWLVAPENSEGLATLVDGRPGTRWLTTRPQRAGDWVEVRFPGPTAVARIEMDMGGWPERYGRSLQVLSQADASPWRARHVLHGRPHSEALWLRGRPVSQVLLLDAEPVTAIRIVCGKDAERKWGMAELRILVRRED